LKQVFGEEFVTVKPAKRLVNPVRIKCFSNCCILDNFHLRQVGLWPIALHVFGGIQSILLAVMFG